MRKDEDGGGAWQRYRDWAVDEPATGLRLDLSRMAISAADLERMAGALRRAQASMRALEAGAIANPDEDRRVGHYWLRDPDRAPDPSLAAAIRDCRARIRAFAGSMQPRSVLWIGIGGSALGPQLLCDALGGPGAGPRVFFLDNTDPDGIRRVLADIGEGLDETLTVVVSKSGRTPETRNAMLEADAALAARGLRLGPRAVAITAEGSELEAWARERGFAAVFPLWDWVGGRTSITSAVGLLAVALLGRAPDAFLEGARLMDAATRRDETVRNPAAALALAWHVAGDGRGARDMVVLPYHDRLQLLGRYLQQLVMESLGKERDLEGRIARQGLVVYGNKGSTDQHAFVQQLREGPDDFFVTFVRVLRNAAAPFPAGAVEVGPGVRSDDYLHGFLLGTREALSEAGRQSVTVSLRDLSERSLGALIALFERAVGLYAALVGINAYHQPGVEAGKRAAGRVLDLQRRVLRALAEAGPEGGTAPDLARQAGAPEDTRTVFEILEHLAASGRAESRPGSDWWDASYRLPQSRGRLEA